MKINLGEKTFERPVIDNDTYPAVLCGISDVFQTTNLNGKSVEKIRIDFSVDGSREEGRGCTLPYFVSAVISDAGERSDQHRNSKLFDLLVNFGVINRFKECSKDFTIPSVTPAQQNEQLITFLRDNLLGREAKILSKTITPKNGDPYSVVDRIVKVETKSEPEEITIED